MPTVINGARTTQTIDTDRRVIAADGISFIDPDQTPLASALSNFGKELLPNKSGPSVKADGVPLKKVMTEDPQFRWFEDTLEDRSDDFDGAEANVAEVDLVVSNIARHFVGSIILNSDTDELMRVSAVTIGTDTITVSRGWGGSTATAILDAQNIVILSIAVQEGSTLPVARSLQTTEVFNYTQIFRTPIDITRTLNDTKVWGQQDLPYKRSKKGLEHMRDMERAFWFGGKEQNTTVEANVLRTTQGILNRLNEAGAPTVAAGGVLSETEFETFLRILFASGSSEKWVYCSPIVISAISGFSRTKLQTFVRDSEYGVSVAEYISPHGSVKIVRQPIFKDDFSGLAVGIDMEYLRMRFLKGADTQLLTNRQANDYDGIKDEYLTEAGIELKQGGDAHATLTGVTG